MILRPVTADDEKILLAWRNDPVTRHASLTQHIIGLNEHAKWFRESLESPSRKIYIAENKGVPVGTFRVDILEELLFLSWTIAPEWRRKGFGKKMIETAELDNNKILKAVIKKNNMPSIKLAHYLGLSLKSEERDLLLFLKEKNG